MRTRDRSGFRRAAALAAQGIGLPPKLAQRFDLERAWREVAGPVLAERVRPANLRRGVLELAVEDPAWARQVVPLIPLLAARLTRAAPGLGVKKFRVTVGGAVRIPPTVPTEVADGPDEGQFPKERTPPQREGPTAVGSAGDPREQLEGLARRYLKAVARREPKVDPG